MAINEIDKIVQILKFRKIKKRETLVFENSDTKTQSSVYFGGRKDQDTNPQQDEIIVKEFVSDEPSPMYRKYEQMESMLPYLHVV